MKPTPLGAPWWLAAVYPKRTLRPPVEAKLKYMSLYKQNKLNLECPVSCDVISRALMCHPSLQEGWEWMRRMMKIPMRKQNLM